MLPVPQPWALFGPSPANQPRELSRIPAEKYTKCVTQCCHHSEGQRTRTLGCRIKFPSAETLEKGKETMGFTSTETIKAY